MENYRLQRKLYEDEQIAVYSAIDIRDQKSVTIREISYGETEEGIPAKVIRESSNLRALSIGKNHPHILTLWETLVRAEQQIVWLVHENLDSMGISLADLMESLAGKDQLLNLIEIQSYAQQLLTGIQYCHQCYILHRNLSLKCLYLIPGSKDTNAGRLLKIGDWQESRKSRGDSIYEAEVGHLRYRSPEVLIQQLSCNKGECYYTNKVDMWAIGCLIYEMLMGQPLFVGDSPVDQLFRIFFQLGTPNEEVYYSSFSLSDRLGDTFKYDKSDIVEYSQIPRYQKKVMLAGQPYLVKGLINNLLQYVPNERYSATQALQDIFFQNKL